jgi:hypothetical protein
METRRRRGAKRHVREADAPSTTSRPLMCARERRGGTPRVDAAVDRAQGAGVGVSPGFSGSSSRARSSSFAARSF